MFKLKLRTIADFIRLHNRTTKANMAISKLDWITSSGGFRDSHRRQDGQKTEKSTCSKLWTILHVKTITHSHFFTLDCCFSTYKSVTTATDIDNLRVIMAAVQGVYLTSFLHPSTNRFPSNFNRPFFQSECHFHYCTQFPVSNVFSNPVATQRNHALIGPISSLASLSAVSSETFSFSQSQSEAPLSRLTPFCTIFPGPYFGTHCTILPFCDLYLCSCHNSSFICFTCYWVKVMG